MEDINEMKTSASEPVEKEESIRERQAREFASIGDLVTASKQVTSKTKYTKDDIDTYLNNIPRYWKDLMVVSDWFYYNNGIYKNIQNSFANLPTLDYLILPSTKTLAKNQDKAYSVYYDKVSAYADSINIRLITRRILKSVARYGAFAGYERSAGSEFAIQTLPLDWVRIKYKVGNDYQLEFNFKYFDKFWTKENIDLAWQIYPPEFKKLYNKYLSDKNSQYPEWQMLDIKKTFFIPFDDDEAFFVPTFAGMFDALINDEDYKTLMKLGQTLDIVKLLVQKVPVDKDGNIAMSADLVKIFHSELVKILPEGANAVTTPLEIEPITFVDRNQAKEDLLAKAERGVFINSGMSSSIFADNSNYSGLQMNIETVTANIFAVLEKIEDVFTRKFTNVVNSKNYEFKLKFFRTTNINIKENFDRMFQLVSIGGAIQPLFSLSGLDVESYITLLQVETELGIKDLLVLPKNMNTQTADNPDSTDSSGRPPKDSKDLTDKGAVTRDTNGNNK